MFSILKRRKRVACAKCKASHPAIYEGESCLICGSPIGAAGEGPKKAGPDASANPKTKEPQTAIDPSQKKRHELRPPSPDLASQRGRPTADYDWQITLAAKGLAERDNYPMPKTVTTPKAFYEIMAAAALDATDLRSLLERATRAERELEIIQDALRRADIDAKEARHQRTDWD